MVAENNNIVLHLQSRLTMLLRKVDLMLSLWTSNMFLVLLYRLTTEYKRNQSLGKIPGIIRERKKLRNQEDKFNAHYIWHTWHPDKNTRDMIRWYRYSRLTALSRQNTSSCTITQVNQSRDLSLPRWGTAWEKQLVQASMSAWFNG